MILYFTSEFGREIFIHKCFKGLPRNLLVDSNIYYQQKICIFKFTFFFVTFFTMINLRFLFDTTVCPSILNVGGICVSMYKDFHVCFSCFGGEWLFTCSSSWESYLVAFKRVHLLQLATPLSSYWNLFYSSRRRTLN